MYELDDVKKAKSIVQNKKKLDVLFLQTNDYKLPSNTKLFAKICCSFANASSRSVCISLTGAHLSKILFLFVEQDASLK